MKNNRLIILLATFTIVVFPVIGFTIAYWVNNEPVEKVLELNEHPVINIVIGLITGFLTGILAWYIIQSKVMTPVRQKYAGLISSLKLSIPKIIYISICAGVGEEILFRGGLQPLLGIWPTSIIFVALHGYLNPMDWRVSIYGIVMTFIIAGYGWLNDYLGILSAITAHAAIDVFLLVKLSDEKDQLSAIENVPIISEEIEDDDSDETEQ